jgi:hypothetical protein
LAQGLSLANAIWSASPEAPLSGLPIITAGNVPLLTESEDSAGRRRLQMSFAAATSSLQDTPDWPIFFSNLVAWRRSGLPGMLTPNVRLGETTAIVLAQDAKEIDVTSPDKSSRKLAVRGRRAVVPADRPGVYLIDTPEGGAPGTPGRQFSVNALSRDESDLTTCQTDRWGSWNQSAAFQDRKIGLGWPLLLGALALMTGHAALVARFSAKSGGGLMMTGGKDSYGPGGYFKSPLEPVMPVSMELRQEHRKLSVAIVVALDRSGSMAIPGPDGRPKIQLADLATAEVINMLGPTDQFGCIAIDTKGVSG